MQILGKCHCGNVAFELELPENVAEIPARACSCTFCTKHGGVWTSHPAAKLVVRVEDGGQVSRYVFGTGTAAFHVCARCGCVPFVTSEIDDRLYAVVNVNVLEGVDSSRLRRASADFDGEDVESRVARRKRNWIADVRIAERRR